MNFKQAFGTHLKMIRKSKKLTQEKLSELVGIHPRQISKIETGDHFPTSSTLENLCIELNVSPQELFDFEFISGSHFVKTGTGLVYNYKATIKDNVVYLKDMNKKNDQTYQVSCADIEEEMFVMAKNIGRSIIVQYLNERGIYKIIEYFPDKTYKLIGKNNENEIKELVDNVKKMSQDEQYLDFIKLAMNALKCPEDLGKLEIMIQGIKLAHKNSK